MRSWSASTSTRRPRARIAELLRRPDWHAQAACRGEGQTPTSELPPPMASSGARRARCGSTVWSSRSPIPIASERGPGPTSRSGSKRGRAVGTRPCCSPRSTPTTRSPIRRRWSARGAGRRSLASRRRPESAYLVVTLGRGSSGYDRGEARPSTWPMAFDTTSRSLPTRWRGPQRLNWRSRFAVRYADSTSRSTIGVRPRWSAISM